MSQRVQMNIEKTIKELKTHKQKNNLTADQTAQITKTRTKHEYRLQRPQKQLIDFLRYIEYETSLNYNRVLGLYKRALFFFPDDARLLVQFAAFMENDYVALKEVLTGMCVRNPLDTDLWVFSCHTAYRHGDVEGGRVLFQKGMRINRDRRMYVEFFRMEALSDCGVAYAVFEDLYRREPLSREVEEMKKMSSGGLKERIDLLVTKG